MSLCREELARRKAAIEAKVNPGKVSILESCDTITLF